MKRQRTWALRFLLVALVVIVALGCYLAMTHQEARPADSGTTPAATQR